MPKCEHCYHYEVCNYFLEKENKHLGSCEGFVCEHFKDKSLILELPCKIGNEAFHINRYGNIVDCKVCAVHYGRTLNIQNNKCENYIVLKSVNTGYNSAKISFKDIGKTVFLTREEAEKALGMR